MADDFEKWEHCLQCAAVTDIGLRRSINQDSHTIVLAPDQDAWRSQGHLFMVADGMGAHAAGELASKIAVDAIPHHYQKHSQLSAPEALQKAVFDTNSEIHRRGQANSDFHNMGTTASMMVILPQGAIVAHIGDSRVYRLRNKKYEQITFDHSLVWEMRELGQVPDDPSLIPKNVITRSLGPNATVQVDIEGPMPVEIGDTFLLCSDGLSGQIEDEEMAAILETVPPPECAELMVDLANLRGGPDNITVVIIQVTGQEMVTSVQAVDPITIGARPNPKVPTAFWIITSVFMLAAAGLLAAGAYLSAAISAACGAASLLIGLAFVLMGRSTGVSLEHGRVLGRGPYTNTPAAPTAEFPEKMSGLIDQIMGQAKDWDVDFSEVKTACAAGQEALNKKNHATAIRAYLDGVSKLFHLLRNHSNKKTSDSDVDL